MAKEPLARRDWPDFRYNCTILNERTTIRYMQVQCLRSSRFNIDRQGAKGQRGDSVQGVRGFPGIPGQPGMPGRMGEIGRPGTIV